MMTELALIFVLFLLVCALEMAEGLIDHQAHLPLHRL